MAITGGIKFFKRSKSLLEDGVSATASTATESAKFMLDRNEFTFWRSVGSSDSITETIEITFPSAVTLTRLLLLDMNFKEFTVKYDLAGVFTDFTTVVGLDGALGGGITETAFADGSAYYEFDSVSTTKLEITATKTLVVDADKFINQVLATEELGTLVGYPLVSSFKNSRNSRVRKVLSGKVLVQKSIETKSFNIDFKNYPNSETADLDLVYTLFDSEEDFTVWLCGGRRGSEFFGYIQRGWRLQDAIPCQVTKDLSTSYSKGLYVGTINIKMSLMEHV